MEECIVYGMTTGSIFHSGNSTNDLSVESPALTCQQVCSYVFCVIPFFPVTLAGKQNYPACNDKQAV